MNRLRRVAVASAALLIVGWLPVVGAAPAVAHQAEPPLGNGTYAVAQDDPPAVASLALVTSVRPSAVTTAGQTIEYSFLVTNTGTLSLTGLTIDETTFTGTGTLSPIACPATTLAPDQSTTCTATYTVSQDDLDAGGIANTATATGTAPGGATATSPRSTAVVNAVAAAALGLVKTAEPATVSYAGQQVTYRFLVTNTGTLALDQLTVEDHGPSGTTVSCPVTTLPPSGQTTCTGVYTVTQADLDRGGGITNTASAAGAARNGATASSPPSTTTVTVDAAPSLALVKSATPPTVTAPGDVVTYRFLVTNNGNLTVDGLAIDETAFSGSGTLSPASCPVTTLVPFDSTTCTATYTVTPSDLATGRVSDTATAGGTTRAGATVTSAPSSATVSGSAGASLSLTKFATPSTVTAAGQTVTYEYVVTNTGGADLNGVAVADTVFSGTGSPPVVSCPVTALTPGGQTTCAGTYSITQADLDAGGVGNTAVASGTDPGGATATSAPSTATVTADPVASLSLAKSVSPGTVTVGQAVSYRFLVTNNGNTTVTGVHLIETAFSGTGSPSSIGCPVTTLMPGESTTFTATYTITRADIDAGGVTNTAVAAGTSPAGAAVASTPSSAIVRASFDYSDLSLTKFAEPSSVSAAGQRVTYRYVLTNSGVVTATDLSVSDTAFSGTGTPPTIGCPLDALGPDEQMTCSGTYTVTQSDVDRGRITNTAEARGITATGNGLISPPSTVTVDIPAAPALLLVKSVDPTAVTAVGQVVTNRFLVTNHGNTTIVQIGITEHAFSGTGTPSPITCPTRVLAPGQQMTCTSTYAVTQADLDAGGITDTAVAFGEGPRGQLTSASSAAVDAEVAAALSVVTSVDRAAFTAAGQRITFSVAVTNTGTATLRGVTVREVAFTGTGPVPRPTCPPGAASLAPGQAVTCTATYPVTQADVDAGSISNTATATGTPPPGVDPPDPAPSTVTVAFGGTSRGGPAKPGRHTDADGRAPISLPGGGLPTTGSDLRTPLIAAALFLAGGGVLMLTRGGSIRRSPR
ncbi:hypothetical protein GCM10023322_79700 [Rugosimonospora acidiphila]|uniref:DUF7507 domain-containing protein n=1 Tax=Rugosimonospora acidiphila TaxID=556531 RepID=A0ABP9SRG8_9ACTN